MPHAPALVEKSADAQLEYAETMEYSPLTHRLSWIRASALCVPLGALLGCGDAGAPNVDQVQPDPMEQKMQPPGACLPDVGCADTPAVGPTESFRHVSSNLVVLAGSPRHRGIDLIATADTTEQVLAGEISYGLVDKALEDEYVDLWSCRAGSWQKLATATTDKEGRFEYRMRGAERFPVGKRQIYASVRGDRSAMKMLAVVLPSGGKAAVSDIDGTLTTYENEYPESLVSGAQVKAHDGAPEAFAALAANCYQPIYLTARGSYFTEDTRKWLGDRGFPSGPLRLAPRIITLPGETTVEYKTSTMAAIESTGVEIVVGNGNRASDAQAYRMIGVPAAQTYLKRPEYASEIDPVIARGEAKGVDSYRALIPEFQAFPRAP